MHDTLFPDNQQSLEEIPHMSIGGWGGWNYVIGSSLLLKNSGGEDITTYCIFDSDYHTSEEIKNRYEQSNRHNIQLHIWTRKEIENYFLIPEAIQRIISNDISSDIVLPEINMIAEQIDKIAHELKDICFDAMATEFLSQDRRSGVSNANKLTREIINDKWETYEGRLTIVSGKSVISKLSDWSNTEFGVSFSSTRIAKELLPKEIDSEVVDIINVIEYNQYISI